MLEASMTIYLLIPSIINSLVKFELSYPVSNSCLILDTINKSIQRDRTADG